MPRYNTPHHTDGPGIGKKLKNGELSARLHQLKEEITQHHWNAESAKRKWLNEVREVGERLIEVKRRLGHKTKWSNWRDRELINPGIMSKETSVDYMLVAREWINPRIEAARANGVSIDSIKTFKKVLRGQPLNQPPKSKTEEYQVMYRKSVRKDFSKEVGRLDYYETELLQCPEVFCDLWGGLFEQLKHYVQVVYGELYDEKEADKKDRDTCQKIRRALNTGRNKTQEAVLDDQ